MKISRRSKILVPIFAVILFIPITAYLYLGSGHFNKQLAQKASELTGDTVELTGKLSVNQVFPKIIVSIPDVKVRAASGNSAYQRMRLEDVEVTLSHQAVTSGGGEGDAHLEVGRSTIIRAPAPDDQHNDKQAENSAGESMARQISSVLENLGDLTVSVELKRIDVIARSEESQNTRYRAFNTKLLASGDILEGSGQFVRNEQDTYLFGFKVPVLTASNDLDQVSGEIDLQAELVGDKDTKYRLSSGFQINKNKIELSKINYKRPGVWLRGDLRIDQSDKTRISGILEARQFELTELEEAEDTVATEEGQQIFSMQAIDLTIADDIELDLQLIFGAIRINRHPIISGVINVQHKDEKLTVESEELYLLGGESEFRATIGHSGEEVSLRLKLVANKAQLRRLQVGENDDVLLTKGAADLIVALKGKGKSIAGIARSLSGYVTAAASDAELNQKYATAIDRGVVSWAREKVALLSRKKKTEVDTSTKQSSAISIPCASLKLYINDGRMEVSNGAILELPDNTLVSSGYVDLHSEQLGFVFRTKSRSLFDWSALSIIKFIEVGGALASPSVALDSKALAKQGLLSTSSIVFGPVPSLVYSLAEAGIKNRQNIQCVPSIQ